MKKLVLFMTAVMTMLGVLSQDTFAQEKPTFAATFIQVDKCVNNELTKYLRLDSTMKFAVSQEDINLVSVSYEVNGVSTNIDFTESVNTNVNLKEYTYQFNGCDFFEENVTPEQVAFIEPINAEIDALNVELDDLKANHYDSNTNKYDTEENAKEAARLNGEIRTRERLLRDGFVDKFHLYSLVFENAENQQYTFTYFVDFQGVSFEGNWIPMTFEDKDNGETDSEPVIPDEDHDNNTNGETENVQEEVKQPVVTPKTSVSSNSYLFVATLFTSIVVLLGLKRKRLS